jgi:hypothetical protein
MAGFGSSGIDSRSRISLFESRSIVLEPIIHWIPKKNPLDSPQKLDLRDRNPLDSEPKHNASCQNPVDSSFVMNASARE